MLTIWHDSTWIEQLITANDDPSYQMSICSVLHINIQYDGSSFIVMSPFDSSWIVSIRQHLQPPFTDTCRIFSKCLANWHPVWRVVICCDELFNSSRFVLIQQHFQPPIADTCGIYSKSLANWLRVCLFTS